MRTFAQRLQTTSSCYAGGPAGDRGGRADCRVGARASSWAGGRCGDILLYFVVNLLFICICLLVGGARRLAGSRTSWGWPDGEAAVLDRGHTERPHPQKSDFINLIKPNRSE